MKKRFDEGLIFKKFDDRGKIFIEYIPIEKAWKPIIGKNFMVINCLWVSGKFKGKGLSTQLLNECIIDTKTEKIYGDNCLLSFEVDDADKMKNEIMNQGLEIVFPLKKIINNLVFEFKDTEGNHIEVFRRL